MHRKPLQRIDALPQIELRQVQHRCPGLQYEPLEVLVLEVPSASQRDEQRLEEVTVYVEISDLR